MERSCVACHSAASDKPAGGLVLDDHKIREGRPASYTMLLRAKDRTSEPYVWPFRARNSLLTWKLFGKRIDGFPEKQPAQGDKSFHGYHVRGGVALTELKGSMMPPPKAVKSGNVAPLTDEDRRTIFRWVDLGCPLDLDFNPKQPTRRGNGWMLDDQRPTLTMAFPQPGINPSLTRILIGMHDYDTGLDLNSFEVKADCSVNGRAAGANLAGDFRPVSDGVWELKLATPLAALTKRQIAVSIRDRQGNTSRILRTYSVK